MPENDAELGGYPIEEPSEGTPAGRQDREPSDTPSPPDEEQERRRRGVRRRFGGGLETVTGLSGVVYKHDDRAAQLWLASAAVWFVIVTSFGMIIATELTVPEFWAGVSWLVFSRVRPCHVEGVIFAWLTMMYFGSFFYFLPRLLGTRGMWSERLAWWTAWFYNAGLILGFWAILDGATQGREYAEFPWLIDTVVLLTFVSNIVNIVMTVAMRHVRPLYVSVWWTMAAPMWVAISIFIENVYWRPGNVWGNPSGNMPTGLHDALINWWGNHNLFGLWLTPGLEAVTYYFVVRLTNTPLYSHTLSLISFWIFVMVYAAVGDHHLLQTPSPGWLKTIASVNSVAILIPVFAFFSNIFLTMRANWNRFFTNLPLRYMLTGFVFYILVNLQGAVFALQPFNHIVHFTYFTIGHSHLALFGGFTILGMGVINYILPKIWNKPLYSRGLAETQYWLVTFGFIGFFTTLTIGGFIQGQSWLNGIPEVLVLPKLRLWNEIRAVTGGMMYASGILQLYLVIMTYFVNTTKHVRRRAAWDAEAELGHGPARM